MVRWMDGLTDGWTVGWIDDGWMDGWMVRWMNEWMDAHLLYNRHLCEKRTRLWGVDPVGV